MRSLSSKPTTSLTSGGTTGDERQVFTVVGNYHGKVVAIKKLPKIDINVSDRAVRLEFKQVDVAQFSIGLVSSMFIIYSK